MRDISAQLLSKHTAALQNKHAAIFCVALCTQGNTTLQSINVSGNSSMDKSWQKLLNHLVKGKAKA